MLRVAFAGTPAFAVPALDALARSPHTIVGVLTRPDRPAGRGRELAASAVKQRAGELDLSVEQPQRLAGPLPEPLASWRPDVLVVVAYGLILPPTVLAWPRWGALNIHASLLPRWRGAAPIQRAILAGDDVTGVCIMQLAEGLDTGPVYARRELPIGPRDATADLAPRLALAGAETLLEVLGALERGTATAEPQPEEGVCYARKVEKREAPIDWSAGANAIARQIRAFNPAPVAETRFEGESVRLWRGWCETEDGVHGTPGQPLGLTADTGDAAIRIAAGRGIVAVAQLQLAGRRPVGARDFANARPLAGRRFGA